MGIGYNQPLFFLFISFHKWIVRNNEYLDFQENTDYIVFTKKGENLNPLGGRPSSEYFLTIDAAKEISMLQRSDY